MTTKCFYILHSKVANAWPLPQAQKYVAALRSWHLGPHRTLLYFSRRWTQPGVSSLQVENLQGAARGCGGTMVLEQAERHWPPAAQLHIKPGSPQPPKTSSFMPFPSNFSHKVQVEWYNKKKKKDTRKTFKGTSGSRCPILWWALPSAS